MKNIIQLIDDKQVFGPFFRGPTWDVWRVFLTALFALPMSEKQLAIYKQFTGRPTAPTTPFSSAWLCCGRRSGKSYILAVIAVFLAAFRDWRPYLGPGEVGTIMIICVDRKQSRVVMRYCLGLLKAIPMPQQLVVSNTLESISLRNRIVIEIHTASYKSTRGYTICAALLDEIAYLQTDETSAEPDVEIINAVKPGMATIPGSIFLGSSSPHARKSITPSAATTTSATRRPALLFWR